MTGDRTMGTPVKKLLDCTEAVPAKGQHKKPCSDCPWARTALPGWLGGHSVEEWLTDARGETRIDCHTQAGAQCAGAAIFRRNICKSPRDPRLLRLEPDRQTCFAHDGEFRAHHGQRIARPDKDTD